MEKHSRSTTFEDFFYIFLSKFSLTLHDYLVTLDRYNFTSILIHEVLIPALQNTSSKSLADSSLHVLLVHLHFLSEVEDLKDILILLITDGTEQSSYRQLLLTVDIGIHDVVDVSSKLNPAALEWDDTCRIEHSTIGVNTLTEENARRAVQLRNDNTLSTIDHESTIISHVRYSTQKYILDKSTEILMVRIRTIQLHFSLQRYAICKTSLQALIDRIARRVNIVIQELKNEIITRIGDREVL